MQKFKPREVNIIDKSKIIFVCGENPGKPNKGSTNEYVFMERRTGKFMYELTKNCKNLVLTNAYNFFVNDLNERLRAQQIGKIELMNLIIQYKPIKIIALGNFAFDTLVSLDLKIKTVKLKHPSFILRFAHNRELYESNLLTEISHV